MHDANRILRLSGTYGRKGRSTDERPHRLAKILSVPSEINRMGIEQIKAFNAKYAIKVEQPQRRQFQGSQNEQFNLRDFIAKHGIKVAKEIPISGGGTKFVLEECPFDPQHKAPDSALFEMPNGSIAFKCFHNSCSQHDWRAFRLHFAPHAYDYENEPRQQYHQQQAFQQKTYAPQKKVYEIKDVLPELGEKWLSMSTIKKVDLSEIESVKTGIIEIDRNIIGLNMAEVSILTGSNACVDCDTEYFNGFEWKKISDYTFGDKVLQYNMDGSAELITPQRYIKSPCDELYLIQSVTGVDQCVSSNHDLVYMTSKGNP